MKRSILMGIMLLAMGDRVWAQTAPFTPVEARSSTPPGVFSCFFPHLDPLCIGRADGLRRRAILNPPRRAHPGEECLSLNFDLVITKYHYDGRAIPLAKLKFGF